MNWYKEGDVNKLLIVREDKFRLNKRQARIG